MKWVQFLLALYVTVLSALPCDTICHQEHKPHRAAAQSSGPVSDPCADDEWCSPFCVCATCPGFTVPTRFAWPPAAVPAASAPTDTQPHYCPPRWHDVPGCIWTPPRLA